MTNGNRRNRIQSLAKRAGERLAAQAAADAPAEDAPAGNAVHATASL